MTATEFQDIQAAFVYAFGPIIGWWLVGVVVLAMFAGIFIFFLSMYQHFSTE